MNVSPWKTQNEGEYEHFLQQSVPRNLDQEYDDEDNNKYQKQTRHLKTSISILYKQVLKRSVVLQNIFNSFL